LLFHDSNHYTCSSQGLVMPCHPPYTLHAPSRFWYVSSHTLHLNVNYKTVFRICGKIVKKCACLILASWIHASQQSSLHWCYKMWSSPNSYTPWFQMLQRILTIPGKLCCFFLYSFNISITPQKTPTSSVKNIYVPSAVGFILWRG
jgi:hypothetical protein